LFDFLESRVSHIYLTSKQSFQVTFKKFYCFYIYLHVYTLFVPLPPPSPTSSCHFPLPPPLPPPPLPIKWLCFLNIPRTYYFTQHTGKQGALADALCVPSHSVVRWVCSDRKVPLSLFVMVS
jgi:hypothetical protein